MATNVLPPLGTRIKNSLGKIFHWGDAFEHSGKFLRTTDRFHGEVHEGEAFEVCHIFENVGDDLNADILIQVGSVNELHLTFSIAAEGKAYVVLYEATTFSLAGTPMVAVNRLRSSVNTSDSTFTHTPTTDSVLGTALACVLVPGGSGGNSIGGTGGSAREEIVLPVDTDYLVRTTNKAGLAKDASITLSWYEEPHGST